MPRLARELLLDVLRSHRVTHVFGNPGSTELPLIDALATADDLRYVLGLQEATVVGMADGYARVTGRPAFLNLHTSAGLGNAIGNLTNAQAAGTPLVVTAGQQDRRHLVADPLLSGDLIAVAGPVSKWAHEVHRSGDLATIMHRAFNDAASAPTGPVFVSLPMDVLDEECDDAVPPPSELHRDVGPDAHALLVASLTLARSGALAIVAGDECGTPLAMTQLVRVAETIAAPVYGAPLRACTVFPQAHPLWAGDLPPAAAGIRTTLAAYDRVLLLGNRGFTAYPYTDGPAVPDGVELLHIAPDPAALGRVHPTMAGIVGEVGHTLGQLWVSLCRSVQDRVRSEKDIATQAIGERRAAERASFEQRATERYGESPTQPMAAVHAVLRAIPHGTPVVDESITAGNYVRGFYDDPTPRRYFSVTRGGGLGWGMPAAVGVSLGVDRSPTVCLVGDGSAMYSPQALWSAAHERLPVVFVVLNNRQYLILKNGLRGRKDAAAEQDRFIGMDLDSPPVDYQALAASMGVPSVRVDSAADAGDAVRAGLDANGPTLIEVPVATP